MIHFAYTRLQVTTVAVMYVHTWHIRNIYIVTLGIREVLLWYYNTWHTRSTHIITLGIREVLLWYYNTWHTRSTYITTLGIRDVLFWYYSTSYIRSWNGRSILYVTLLRMCQVQMRMYFTRRTCLACTKYNTHFQFARRRACAGTRGNIQTSTSISDYSIKTLN
jgi:hypothetical protein